MIFICENMLCVAVHENRAQTHTVVLITARKHAAYAHVKKSEREGSRADGPLKMAKFMYIYVSKCIY